MAILEVQNIEKSFDRTSVLKCSVTVLIWLIALRKMDIMGNNSENQIN